MNPPQPSKQPLNRREWIWLAVTVSGLLLVYLSPLREHLAELRTFKEDIAALGVHGKLMFVAVGLLTLLWLCGGVYFRTSNRFKALRAQPQP